MVLSAYRQLPSESIYLQPAHSERKHRRWKYRTHLDLTGFFYYLDYALPTPVEIEKRGRRCELHAPLCPEEGYWDYYGTLQIYHGAKTCFSGLTSRVRLCWPWIWDIELITSRLCHTNRVYSLSTGVPTRWAGQDHSFTCRSMST